MGVAMMTNDEPDTVDRAVEGVTQEGAAREGRMARLYGGVRNGVTRMVDYLYAREFRVVPTAVALTATVILLGLATWQLMRLAEKNALLTTVEARMNDAPVILNGRAARTDTQAWENLHYRAVTLQGRFLPLFQFKLVPRTYEGQVGYQLVMPLELADRQVVLVNRGFVADGVAMMPAADEVVTIQGIAHIPQAEKPAYRPENVPSRGIWSWVDLKAMSHETGMRNVAPIIVYETRDSARDSFPIGGQLPLPSHNRHWHYAVTWYCLALALMGVWIMSSTPKKPTQDDTRTKAQDVETMDPVARRGLYPEPTD